MLPGLHAKDDLNLGGNVPGNIQKNTLEEHDYMSLVLRGPHI